MRYALQDSLALLIDAESAQRGYLLTKSNTYLAAYFASLSQLHSHIKDVQDLVSGNPTQHSHAQELGRVIDAKIEELKGDMSAIKDMDAATAIESYHSGEAHATANEIRTAVDKMIEEEEQLFELRAIDMENMTRLTVMLFVALLVLFAGVMAGYSVLTNRNMALRNSMMAKLVAANAETERADKFKGDLLNYLGRVLYEPLSRVTTSTDLLLLRADNALQENDHKIVTEIRANVRFLLSLAANFPHIGRLQAGKALQLEEDDIDLGDIVRDVAGIVAIPAAKAGINLRHTLPFGRALIRCDKQKLKQILLNLLDNAVKHTPSGGSIELSAAKISTGDLTVTVQDTGSGISPDRLRQVMIPFAQIEDMSARGEQGIGLGLPMALGFAQAHGGKLELFSDGHGTTAVLTLPASRVIRVFDLA